MLFIYIPISVSLATFDIVYLYITGPTTIFDVVYLYISLFTYFFMIHIILALCVNIFYVNKWLYTNYSFLTTNYTFCFVKCLV